MTLTGQITPHFSWREAASHDASGDVPVPPEYQDNARAVCRESERIRRVCGNKPLTMTRLFSTAQHNATIPGAAKNSQHLKANAADILPPGAMTTEQLGRIVQMLATEPESRIRFIRVYADGHVHFDLRPGMAVVVEGLS